MKDTPWKKYVTFALFCAVVYVPLFHHLTWEPIHNWDESLFAMRAGYMAEEGAYLPDYSHWVEGGPKHPNSKPPFTTWVQALSMKIFGVPELGLRLPVAFSALATVFLFLWFFRKKIGDIRIGYCAGFVLVTSLGYVRAHAARTGDQDVPLALYMLAGAFAFYQYIGEKDERKRWRWLALLTFLLIISALT
ncbi:MAG: ArnT family glycosyltransferase, partial [Saprospiraceae bacterium]